MNRNSHDAWKATITIGLLIVGIGAVGLVIGYDRLAHDRNPGTGVIDEEESNVDLRTDAELAKYISDECKTYDVDEGVVRAIIEAESGWNADAINLYTAAAGLMQIVPSAWGQMVDDMIRRFDAPLTQDDFNPMDARDNVLVGIYLLSHLLDAHGSYPMALLYYACGTVNADAFLAAGHSPMESSRVKLFMDGMTGNPEVVYEAKEGVEK